MPMSEIPSRIHELDRGREIVVYCHHGVRSRKVAEFLVRQGFSRVANLAGGIDAWSLHVDSRVPRY
jgi:rhodanese-related sulfurtransferase